MEEILCCEQSDEEIVDGLADLLLVLDSTGVHFERTQTLVKGICFTLMRFTENSILCLKLIELFRKRLSNEESKLIYLT